MKNQTQLHLDRLKARHGTHTAVAKAIGLDVRDFRRYRKQGFPPNVQRLIRLAGKYLVLRLVLVDLLQTGKVTRGAVKESHTKATAFGSYTGA